MALTIESGITIGPGITMGDAGGGSYGAPSIFRMVQVSQTQYQVYGYFASYTSGSTYSVQITSYDTWVHSGTPVSAPTGNYIAITPTSF